MPILPKQELRQLVSVASTDDALRQLLDLLAGVSAHSKVYKAINLLSGQWQELDEQVRLNLLPFKEASMHRARVNAAVLDYLDELPDEIGATSRSQTAVSEIALRQSVQTLAADMDWEYDLFFSFSSKDLDAARAFCYALRGYGLRVFFSPDDLRLRGGDSFGAVIEQALGRSRHFLLFCTPDAMQSEWVRLEHDTFFQQYHLKDTSRRGFYIAEGPDFYEGLLPSFYRRYQRVTNEEMILHTLAKFGPTTTNSLKPSEGVPLKPSPQSTTKISPADEASWRIACKTNTEAAYQGYLDKWSNGYYADQALSHMEDLKHDQDLWDYLTVHSKPTTLEDNLRAYLEAYPEGLHFRAARSNLVSIERKRTATNEKRQKKLEAEAWQRQQAEVARQNREAAVAEKKRRDEAAAHLKSLLPEMVFVKGGTFQMGYGPVHAVTLSDFEIGKYPVTQKQWTEIMGSNSSGFKDCDDCPVEQVFWDDAQEFLKKLNARFPGKNYRLPTEAEWEFAARGGNQTKGYAYAGGNDLNEVGWYADNADGKTHPVGQKKANELGLHDMSGNVWEWCADWYGHYPETAQTNPAGPTSGSYRVSRGGSWYLAAWQCRVSYRGNISPGRGRNNISHLGFRVASSSVQ
jgi:formylglycine-generating enzyme required for sulfatase activity